MGMFAVFSAIKGLFGASALFCAAAVMFDYLDGRVARLAGGSNELGKQLDSLADMVSFGVWPAVFGYALGLRSPAAVCVLAFFAACGMLRLARFNVTNIRHFEGVPITTNGIVFPVLYFLLPKNAYAGALFEPGALALYALMGLLMISTIRVKKL